MAGDRIDTVYGPIAGYYECRPLLELCVEAGGVQTGPFGSQLHQEDYVAAGTPIITVEHLGENRIQHVDLPRVSDADRDRLMRYTLKQGDIVFSRVGSVDRRALVREAEEGWLFSGRCLRVRVDQQKIQPEYLSWFFGLPGFREHVRRVAVGATMPSINTKILGDVQVYFPPLPEQKRIAQILGTLDDKIELNRRMNATLEAISRAIFKSWFVDFDPVRQKAAGKQPVGMDAHTAALFPSSFQDSRFGPIPAGWKHTTLADVCSLITDGAHQSPKSVEAGFPMASVKDMTNWEVNIPGCRHISAVDFHALVANGCLPERGDILLAKDGATCLDTACEYQQSDEIVVLSSVAILRPKNCSDSAFIHNWLGLSSTKTYLKENFVSGSAIPRVVLRDLRRAQVVSPPRAVLDSFSDAASPLRKQIRHSHEQLHTIAALRDTLLHKLLSGELRVPEAEQSVEEAIA